MIHADDAGAGRHGRRRRAVSEKLEIVRLTMEPGTSVAEIARAHGVNANQVFKWRRLFERGELRASETRSTALLPITISADADSTSESAGAAVDTQESGDGVIHIELPGKATHALLNPCAELVGRGADSVPALFSSLKASNSPVIFLGHENPSVYMPRMQAINYGLGGSSRRWRSKPSHYASVLESEWCRLRLDWIHADISGAAGSGWVSFGVED